MTCGERFLCPHVPAVEHGNSPMAAVARSSGTLPLLLDPRGVRVGWWGFANGDCEMPVKGGMWKTLDMVMKKEACGMMASLWSSDIAFCLPCCPRCWGQVWYWHHIMPWCFCDRLITTVPWLWPPYLQVLAGKQALGCLVLLLFLCLPKNGCSVGTADLLPFLLFVRALVFPAHPQHTDIDGMVGVHTTFFCKAMVVRYAPDSTVVPLEPPEVQLAP